MLSGIKYEIYIDMSYSGSDKMMLVGIGLEGDCWES